MRRHRRQATCGARFQGELLDRIPHHHLSSAPRVQRAPHILVVAYDEETLTALIRPLVSNGFRVSVVPDAAVMERALTERPMDLVIVDGLLPGEEGLSLCRRVRRFGGLFLILLASQFDEARALQELAHGTDGYLIKPFNTEELLAQVRATLARSSPGQCPT